MPNPDDFHIQKIREILEKQRVNKTEDLAGPLFDDGRRIPWERPDLNWRPGPSAQEEWLAIERTENARLTAENTQLRGIVGTLLAWLARRPKSASRIGAFTSVPRQWWLEGESLMEAIVLPALPSQAETDLDDPPTGPIEHPNREA